MNIFYSCDDAIEKINSKGYPVSYDNGWGNLAKHIKTALSSHTIVDNVEKADLELYIGQPFVYKQPQMSPNIIYTMWEKDNLPDRWIKFLSRWDIVCNPTQWGTQSFRSHGIDTIYVTPPINFDKFQYIDRTTNNWTYYIQVKYLVDRKHADELVFVFKDELPDSNLIVKLVPPLGMPEFDMQVHSNVRIIQQMLSLEDLADLHSKCHVSLNLSLAEGIGLIPCETMATGMYTVFPNYSAFKEIANNKYNYPLDVVDGEINIEQLINIIKWTNDNREESLKIGKLSSEYIRDKYHPDKFMSVFNELELPNKQIKRVWQDNDDLSDWIDEGLLEQWEHELK